MRKSLFLALVLLVVGSDIHTQSMPTKLVVDGLSDEVTVRRDGRGIPYIEAKNDSDIYFAQGYVFASDRLWQMDLMRRLARGETAEIFGQAALEQDKRWRRFNFAKVAEESLRFMTPDLRAALDNYARGVNAYIATLTPETLPVEFRILQYKPREWSATDTIAVGKILADALSSTWDDDVLLASLQKIAPEKLADIRNQVTPNDVILFGSDTKAATARSTTNSVPAASSDALAVLVREKEIRRASLESVGLYAEGLAASNNWVISGKRTVDGRAMLANDPHLAPTAPGIWYLVHLSTPTLRVSGVSIPGSPGVTLGHNADIAWGATNVGPDVQDVYIETLDRTGGGVRYKTPIGWEDAVVRKETIKVRKNPLKPETEDVAYEVIETRHGPIVLSDGDKHYALRWTALDPKNGEFEAFHTWNRAKNWEEFKNGLKRYGGSAQNFIYADVKGNIGWYAASRIPIRKTGDGSLPYDGATNDGDWTGFIPFEDLPHLYNPPSGLIITANQRVVGTSYKYTQFSRDAATPWRARRIKTILEAKPKLTMDDSRDAQLDAFNIPLSNLAKNIVKMGAASPETLADLKAWNGVMAPDSRAALLVNDIRICTANKLADANKPVPAYAIRERVLDWAVTEQSARWLPAGHANWTELIKSCDTAVRAMFADPKRYGPDQANWSWGKLWKSRFDHPLAVAPLIGMQFQAPSVPITGSGQTPNVGSAVSMRHIASPGNWDATRHVIPLGQSGDPKSPHFKDQFELWRTGEPSVFPFTKDAVSKAATSTIVLSPR